MLSAKSLFSIVKQVETTSVLVVLFGAVVTSKYCSDIFTLGRPALAFIEEAYASKYYRKFVILK